MAEPILTEESYALSLIINLQNDPRPHAEVEIEGHTLVGLLDSGASVTILGAGADDIRNLPNISRQRTNTSIRTADGTIHSVNHYLLIPYIFNNQRHTLPTLDVPSIAKPLILGVDFWKAFHIQPSIKTFVGDNIHNSVLSVSEGAPSVFEVDISENITSAGHNLTSTQKKNLDRALKSFRFADDGPLGCTPLVKHTINTGMSKPLRQRQYVVSPYVQLEMNAEIDRLLTKGIIEPSPNPEWLNPVIAVRKPSGRIRLCIDARKLNERTIKDAYPQQNLNHILSRLRGTKYLSTVDLSDAFYQVELEEKSRSKTSFSIGSRGTFRYRRMPMGLCNSGATLCALIDSIFGDELQPYLFCYLDDLVVATDTLDHHIEILKIVADRLRKAGLSISSEKSKFCVPQVKFLGHIISKDGISPDTDRIKPILEYPAPNCVKSTRRLLGMAGWFRKFVPNFANIAAPISQLLKKTRAKFMWTSEAQEGFETLKKALSSPPVLATPNYNREFTIVCDASQNGLGAAILQKDEENNERAIAYMSQKLTPAQQKYHVTEKECLAVLTAINKFRPYIEGAPRFIVVTDHASLKWLQNLKDPAGRLARWALQLQGHNYVIEHRKGREMALPDALSRSVDMLEFSEEDRVGDDWYNQLRAKVLENPDEYPCNQVMGGDLLQFVPASRLGRESGWKLVVPEGARLAVLKECHDNVLAAHGGYAKTVRRIGEKYFWPRMHNEVRKYLAKCDVCKAAKPTNKIQRPPKGLYAPIDRPWRRVSLDFVGPLPRSKRGNTFLFVVVDAFTKYVVMTPLRNSKAMTTVPVLRERVFLKFGVPETIWLDNGKQLISTDFNKFLDTFGVKNRYTPYFHPQSNPCEAANATLVIGIRSYVMSHATHDRWDEEVPDIMCSLNTSEHSSTEQTPYRANFGRDMVTFGNEYRLGDLNGSSLIPHEDKLKSIRTEIGVHLRKADARMRKQYNKGTRPIEYTIGERVWRRNFKLSKKVAKYTAKLGPLYVPCVVLRRVGTVAYELKDEPGDAVGIYQAKDMKKD